MQEVSIFNFVQSEIKRSKRTNDQNLGEFALSNDDKAFLSQLPSPNGGVRLYLATSNEPFSQWSKPNNFPSPPRYNVSSKDFIGESLSLVKKRFGM